MVDYEIRAGDIEHEDLEREMLTAGPSIEYRHVEDMAATFPLLFRRMIGAMFPLLRTSREKRDVNNGYGVTSLSQQYEVRDKATKEILYRPTRSPKRSTELFSYIYDQWKISEQCRQLKATLQSAEAPHNITKIVGIGLGSWTYLCTEEDEDAWDRRAAYQHAMLLTVRDVLNSRAGSHHHIACYVQDPVYTESCKSILNKHNISVLDDPQGFLEVDESTVVISYAPIAPIRQIVSDIATPAMLIWMRVGLYFAGRRAC